MSSKAAPASSADEQPKRSIAQKVVSAKRRYFFPHRGVSVLAEGIKDAETELEKLTKPKRKRATKRAAPTTAASADSSTSTETPDQTSDVKAGDD